MAVGAQSDDLHSRAYLTAVDLGVGERTWLRLTAGQSLSPSARADVTANTLAIGVDRRIGKFGLILELENWGDSHSVESSDTTGSVYMQLNRFRIGYQSERRDIRIPVTTIGTNDRLAHRIVDVSGYSDSVYLRAQVVPRLHFNLRASKCGYSRNLRAIPRIDSLNLLSASTVTLANSFIDRFYSIGVEARIRRGLFSVGFSRDRSAIDGNRLTALDAAWLFPISQRIDLELNIGRGDSGLFPSSHYAGLLFLFYGG